MKTHALTVGAFDENTWFLHDAAQSEVVLVDPGDEPQRLLAELDALGARLVAIWLTHAHIDHIGGIAGVKARWPAADVFSHPLDAPLLLHAPRIAATYGLPFDPPPPPERALAEGDILSFAGERFEVWHLPGHAPGHVAFIGAGHCFSGDLLFAGSIGRTDLPLCDPAAMERSLARLSALPEELIVHPGHGPETTIGRERATNPFLTGVARVVRR
jgi:hydroxyacylglutathione hydrolase